MIFTIISQNKKDISQIQIPKENSKVVKEDNLGEHVFFVQLDSELPMPHFYINISKEKKKIENIGGIKNSYFGNKIGNDDNPDSERSKQISDIVNMSPEVIQKGIDRPFSRNQQDAKQFMNNYTGMPSAFISNMSPVPKHSRLKSLSYNDKVADQKPVEPPIAQKVTETEETFFLGDTNNGREMFWFKWDTFESWKYSFKDDAWSLLEDAKPPNKFLYFSSTCHLKENAGCYILGGCDFEDNYSKRVLHFEGYNTFRDKAPMIATRAFFTSIYCDIDSSIYVFGGNDSHEDLSQCERYSIAENIWRQISPLNIKRNGASSILMPESKSFYIFGGNNKDIGSLDSIEKYEIEYDKWILIDIKLKYPLHDLASIYLGGCRAMIFGGNNENGISKTVEIVDLSSESNKLKLNYGGKSYYSPMIDEFGKLHLFNGYGDSQLIHELIDITDKLQAPILQKK